MSRSLYRKGLCPSACSNDSYGGLVAILHQNPINLSLFIKKEVQVTLFSLHQKVSGDDVVVVNQKSFVGTGLRLVSIENFSKFDDIEADYARAHGLSEGFDFEECEHEQTHVLTINGCPVFRSEWDEEMNPSDLTNIEMEVKDALEPDVLEDYPVPRIRARGRRFEVPVKGDPNSVRIMDGYSLIERQDTLGHWGRNNERRKAARRPHLTARRMKVHPNVCLYRAEEESVAFSENQRALIDLFEAPIRFKGLEDLQEVEAYRMRCVEDRMWYEEYVDYDVYDSTLDGLPEDSDLRKPEHIRMFEQGYCEWHWVMTRERRDLEFEASLAFGV